MLKNLVICIVVTFSMGFAGDEPTEERGIKRKIDALSPVSDPAELNLSKDMKIPDSLQDERRAKKPKTELLASDTQPLNQEAYPNQRSFHSTQFNSVFQMPSYFGHNPFPIYSPTPFVVQQQPQPQYMTMTQPDYVVLHRSSTGPVFDMKKSDDPHNEKTVASQPTLPQTLNPAMVQATFGTLDTFLGNFMRDKSRIVCKLRKDRKFVEGLHFVIFAKIMESKGCERKSIITYNYPNNSSINHYIQLQRKKHENSNKSFEKSMSHRLKNRYNTIKKNIEKYNEFKDLFWKNVDLRRAFLGQ